MLLSNINLPISYIEEMKELFKDDFDEFISSYNQKPYKGISINTKKISIEEFLSIKSDCVFKNVPWSKDMLDVIVGNI